MIIFNDLILLYKWLADVYWPTLTCVNVYVTKYAYQLNSQYYDCLEYIVVIQVNLRKTFTFQLNVWSYDLRISKVWQIMSLRHRDSCSCDVVHAFNYWTDLSPRPIFIKRCSSSLKHTFYFLRSSPQLAWRVHDSCKIGNNSLLVLCSCVTRLS